MEESWALIPGMADPKNPLRTDKHEEWNDANRLLFQSGYVKVIKEMALSGQLQQYNIRSVCWRLFLGCLPEDQSKWEETVKKSREKFATIKSKHIIDPHSLESDHDLAVNNPLSLADDSPWNQYFQDNELRQVINQDVVRTFPDVQFFRQPDIQKVLVDLLFCYSRENEELGYRQGMHEILAPILFVLHAELRDLDDPALAPEVQIVTDNRYIEHDAYTIFAELMETVGGWYMSTALEADYYKARAQNKRKMTHDPRTNKPFEAFNDVTPTSAISRKLGVIHNLHLKKTDEELHTHLKELSIPPQTYGIRWIRLLFGREFPLPSVLELWDALFADGPSLGLVDYMCVAMLMHMRDVLTGGDYATCMHYLMHFPPVYEVNYLVQRALHFRNPSSYPSPRIWSHSPKAQVATTGSTHSLVSPTEAHHQPQQHKSSHHIKMPTSVKQAIKNLPKLGTRSSTSTPRLEFHGGSKSDSQSPSPSDDPPLLEHPLQTPDVPVENVTKKGRSRGSSKKDITSSSSQEMSENPKSTPITDASSSQLDKLRNRIEDLEAKCLYCGGKADSLTTSLQKEIVSLKGLPPETENTLLLSLASLKQVRDLLLNKIPFTGETTSGWENALRSKVNSEESQDASSATLDDDHLSTAAAKNSHPTTKNSSRTSSISITDHPSKEVGTETLAEDGGGSGPTSSTTHPLSNGGN